MIIICPHPIPSEGAQTVMGRGTAVCRASLPQKIVQRPILYSLTPPRPESAWAEVRSKGKRGKRKEKGGVYPP